jgi:hypothetical protein
MQASPFKERLLTGDSLKDSIFAGCWGAPQYGVYSQRLEGEAELAKANYSKQVAVQEANAKKDSASLLADAEVLRAEGVAKANKIIGYPQ